MSGFSLGALQRLMEDLEESLRERCMFSSATHERCCSKCRMKGGKRSKEVYEEKGAKGKEKLAKMC